MELNINEIALQAGDHITAVQATINMMRKALSEKIIECESLKKELAQKKGKKKS